jgi:hypothetical protein
VLSSLRGVIPAALPEIPDVTKKWRSRQIPERSEAQDASAAADDRLLEGGGPHAHDRRNASQRSNADGRLHGGWLCRRMTTTPTPKPEPTPTPTACPFCQSSKITTPSEKVDANTYWRCDACGQMWNVERQRATNRNRFGGRWNNGY